LRMEASQLVKQRRQGQLDVGHIPLWCRCVALAITPAVRQAPARCYLAHLPQQFADLKGRRHVSIILLMTKNVKTTGSAHFWERAAD
jgi:hypothetical protein